MVNFGKPVLALGAHPDDVEYGCGGFLQKFEKRFIYISHAVRVGEAERAARILNARCEFMSRKNPNPRQAIGEIERKITEYSPGTILVNWSDDTHQDHRMLADAVLSAVREFTGTILFYCVPSSRNFNPDIFCELTEGHWQAKIEALAAHESQKDKVYFAKENIEAAFRHWKQHYRGAPGYVEPFALYRTVI